MSSHTFVCSFAVLCCASLVVGGEDKETKLKPGEVPAAVVAAASKQYPGAHMSNWTKETEDGKTTYEASMKDGSSKRDLVFAENGALFAVEEVIPVSDLPAAVKKAILGEFPGASLRKAEKICHGDEVQYEVALGRASVKEVLLTPDGRIVKNQ
jgi:hypothetical protein